MNDEAYKSAFTEVDGNINIDANNINVNCITSKNNKFSLDSDGNLVVNSITTAEGSSNFNIDSVYPVGSIYMSVVNTSPNTLFGGTWERITDKFLLASGNTYTAGTTGGSASHNHETRGHTLTINEMPGHKHDIFNYNADGMYPVTEGYGLNFNGTPPFNTWGATLNMSYTGGNESHDHGTTYNASNIPPYLAVYIWKRIS